jgi:glucose uptake protein GlcU
MATIEQTAKTAASGSLHGLGVLCGIAAGAWLGAAEAPTKLVSAGFSPFAISLCMVAGVFVARWTFPTLLCGTGYIVKDLFGKPHLIVWAILAGALWAVGNTLTVFAIRDVGLSIAFPLWNTNSLIGILWGSLLFNELKGASAKNWAKVLLGAVAIVVAATMLGFSSMHATNVTHAHAVSGVLAALGASFMWGTMYVPYRKAYLSGMNPLSFVTAFTIGELGTMLALTAGLTGGIHAVGFEIAAARPFIFWLFLGGFCWVVGDLFQQYAAKYIGIGRGIPLSNTNQLWGLLWGALVFGELAGANRSHQVLVIAGSLLMLLGAVAISTAVASGQEHISTEAALVRECDRYGLDYHRTLMAQAGVEDAEQAAKPRRWWDYCIIAAAVGLFVWFARGTVIPPLALNIPWIFGLTALLIVFLLAGGSMLWKRTRFF